MNEARMVGGVRVSTVALAFLSSIEDRLIAYYDKKIVSSDKVMFCTVLCCTLCCTLCCIVHE